MPIEVTFEAEPTIDHIAALWKSVEEDAAHSFFMSWQWIGCWLRETGLRPNLLIARRAQRPVGLALLHRHPGRWAFWPPPLHLTSAGNRAFDSIFIEYNGFLASATEAAAVELAFVGFLNARSSWCASDRGWVRLAMPGVSEAMRNLFADSSLSTRCTARRPSPWINLAEIRARQMQYLQTRSRNFRHQVRRTIRLLEATGQLCLVRAGSLDDALETFDELKFLHQKQWREKNRPGAFAEPFFERFHRSLIRSAWPVGQIDLFRLRLGTATIGCLYNFVQGGNTYAYQSGFDLSRDVRHKPGLVSHALAIQHYLDRGFDRYLLLAGENRYKSSLATDSETLYWLVVRRPGLLALADETAELARRLSSAVLCRLPWASH